MVSLQVLLETRHFWNLNTHLKTFLHNLFKLLLSQGFLREEHTMLFSETMVPLARLTGNIPAGCPDIQASALSSTFNEVNVFKMLYSTL